MNKKFLIAWIVLFVGRCIEARRHGPE